VALDERLRQELERAGRPADPSGVYEELIRKRERRRVIRKVEGGVLAVVVVLGSISGFYALTRVFPSSEAPEVATPSISNGEIVFSIPLEGEGEALMAVSPDGTGLRRLSPQGVADYRSPDVSPDGRTVVVVHEIPSFGGDQTGVLATVPIQGGSPTWLTDEPAVVQDPVWSPDGTSIAFNGDVADGPFGLYVLDLDTDEAHLIPGTENMLTGEPTWSPDGTRLAFEGSTPDPDVQGVGVTRAAWDIYVVTLDGSNLRNLTQTPDESEVWPAWSWETDRIAFVRGVPRGSGVYTMAPDGTDTALVFDALPNLGTPAWSPDGTMIAFTAETGQVYTIAADGGQPSAVAGAMGEPSWQAIPQNETISPTPTPSRQESPSPASEDIGLGFPVCDVTSVDGTFAPGVVGKAYVATRTGDLGCPAPGDGLQVVAVDVTGDGMADASYGPLECDRFCSAFSAPDVNGDGVDEVLIQNVQFSIAGLQMFVVVHDADQPTVEPVTIAPPGDPGGGFEPGAIPQLWLGGDAFSVDTLRCGTLDAPIGPGLVYTTAESLPHDSPDAEWHAHEVTFALRNAELHVVDVRDFTEPVGSDAPSFQSGERLCGSNLGPSQA
jgi:Tol biopolymer transport system component